MKIFTKDNKLNNPEFNLQETLTYLAMKNMRRPETIKSNRPLRNKPCPCGSGKKFKKCCNRTI